MAQMEQVREIIGDNQRGMSPEEAAAFLGISLTTLRRRVSEKSIRVYPGRRVLLERADVERLRKSMTAGQ